MPAIDTLFALTFAQAQPGGSPMGMIMPFVLMGLAFWFLIIAPQRKQQKQHKEMIESLKEGDKVIMNGGLCGTVAAVKKERLTLRIADNGTKVEVAKEFVNRKIDKASQA